MPNLSINTFKDTKKLLEFCFEKYGYNKTVTGLKSHMILNNEASNESLRLKGVPNETNHITNSDYNMVINEGTVINDHYMLKITVIKNTLAGFNNKVITLPNGAYLPYIH